MHPRSFESIKEAIRSSGIEEIHQNPVATGCPDQRRVTREIHRLWETAELGITPHLRSKLERQKIRCGDGMQRQ
jgi:hypothetical protein